jgi:hypothetical protein
LQPLVGSRDHTNEMLVPFWRISGSRRKHELGLDAASLDGEGDGQVDGQSAICCFNDQIPFAQAKHNDEASGRNLNLKRVSRIALSFRPNPRDMAYPLPSPTRRERSYPNGGWLVGNFGVAEVH